jgi:hypothetical protein
LHISGLLLLKLGFSAVVVLLLALSVIAVDWEVKKLGKRSRQP